MIGVVRILAICGSLRSGSINSAVLRAAKRLAPSNIDVAILQGIGDLPLFNPDLEARLPSQIAAFHAQVLAADALLIASPEYAHGISGLMKNALDWLVSFEPFVFKPVAVLNTSPRAQHADAALREVLATMSATIVAPASISIPLLGANLTEEQILERPELVRALRGSLAALCAAVGVAD